MAEEWMKELARKLGQEDHEAAEEIQRRNHRAEILTAKARPLFVTFAECFKKLADDMDALLRENVLHSAQICNVSTGQNLGVTLDRKMLPFVHADIRLQGSTGQPTLSVSYNRKNPELLPGQAADSGKIQARFEVDEHDEVYIILDGQDFHQPKEAAEFLIKLMFTFTPPSAPVVRAHIG